MFMTSAQSPPPTPTDAGYAADGRGGRRKHKRRRRHHQQRRSRSGGSSSGGSASSRRRRSSASSAASSCLSSGCSSCERARRTKSSSYYLRLLSEFTTFHGVRDCYHSRSTCARWTWLMIILAAVFAALQGCYLIVEEFIARPVIVTYLIEEAERRGMHLPDIIICPFNRFNRSYFNAMNISDGLAQYLELSYPSPVLHLFQMRKYRATIRQLDDYDAELSALLARIGNVSFTNFIKQSAIDCTAFFENQEVCQNLTEIMTSAGKCFRIPGSIQEGDGFGYGARFVIKLPHHLYNPGVNQMLNDGIAVKLAERNRGIDHDLSFIPSGVHAIMPLSATRYEFINDPPRYKCRERDTTYSRVWCFEVCLTERAERKCNCTLAASQAAVAADRDNAQPPQLCTTRQFFRCFAPMIFHTNMTYDIERCKAQCKPPCTYWSYAKTISYAHFPSEQARFFVDTDAEWDSLKHTIILEVYYANLDYTIIRHIRALTPSGFLAQIGGQISLWIGGSIISMIQMFVYLSGAGYTAMCYGGRRQRRGRRNADAAAGGAPDDGVAPPDHHHHHHLHQHRRRARRNCANGLRPIAYGTPNSSTTVSPFGPLDYGGVCGSGNGNNYRLDVDKYDAETRRRLSSVEL